MHSKIASLALLAIVALGTMAHVVVVANAAPEVDADGNPNKEMIATWRVERDCHRIKDHMRTCEVCCKLFNAFPDPWSGGLFGPKCFCVWR